MARTDIYKYQPEDVKKQRRRLMADIMADEVMKTDKITPKTKQAIYDRFMKEANVSRHTAMTYYEKAVSNTMPALDSRIRTSKILEHLDDVVDECLNEHDGKGRLIALKTAIEALKLQSDMITKAQANKINEDKNEILKERITSEERTAELNAILNYKDKSKEDKETMLYQFLSGRPDVLHALAVDKSSDDPEHEPDIDLAKVGEDVPEDS